MFIEIESLKDEPLHIRHDYAVEDLVFDHDDAFLAEPVSVDFILTHKEKELRLWGTVQTEILYECARCLREFTRRLSASFDVLYLPQPQWTEADDEIELKYEDMEVGFYDGIRLDVDLMILEQIELSIPMRFICRENCKGLCYKCGKDLNEGDCGCGSSQPDSRLADLLEFRNKSQK